MYECILERYAELYSMPWVKNARINEGEDNHPVLQHFIATAQSLLRVLGHIRSFILANDAAQQVRPSIQQSLRCVPMGLFFNGPCGVSLNGSPVVPRISSR